MYIEDTHIIIIMNLTCTQIFVGFNYIYTEKIPIKYHEVK
jgi:hypothetical protein